MVPTSKKIKFTTYKAEQPDDIQLQEVQKD